MTVGTLNSRAESLRRYVAAIVKASRYLAQNKQAWIDGMSVERPDITPADLGSLWDEFDQSWAVNGQLNPPSLSLPKGGGAIRGTQGTKPRQDLKRRGERDDTYPGFQTDCSAACAA